MFLLYNVVLTLLAPVWIPWMLARALRRSDRPDWSQRMGSFPIRPGNAPRLWFHAVSVGEVVASMPILQEVRKLAPEVEIVLTVTTSSGHRTAREHAAQLYDHLLYFPLDIPRFQLGAMQRVQPKVVAIMETELWLNFLWAAKAFDAKTLLINGRISDRSFPRSMRLRPFFKALLKNIDRCLMQSERDAERIRALGARSAEVLGNCKFDQAASSLQADPMQWRSELGIPPENCVLVIGSTRGEDEERLVLDALRRLELERVSVIHAPRHLERVEALAAAVSPKLGPPARRSLRQSGPYLILDTYGELDKVYSVADVVIVGGGFGDYGGQNLLQPLAHGKPVLHGPHMQNFRDVAEAAVSAGASKVCLSADELASNLQRLLADPEERARMGGHARNLVQQNLGASRRYAEAIAAALAE